MNLKLSVRHIVAMVLIVLSIVCLFWPSVAGVSAMGQSTMYSVSEVRSEMTSNIGEYFDAAELFGFKATLLGIFGILINVCFFGMIAAAVLALVMILLNKSNVAAVLLAILAILAVVVCAVYVVILIDLMEMGGLVKFAPGVAMFLLPIFAIATCILAKKEA